MAASLSDPAQGAFAVTPSDSTVLAGSRALYIGVSGDVAVIAKGSTSAVTFKSVPIGLLPVMCSKVLATNTTATNIISLT